MLKAGWLVLLLLVFIPQLARGEDFAPDSLRGAVHKCTADSSSGTYFVSGNFFSIYGDDDATLTLQQAGRLAKIGGHYRYSKTGPSTGTVDSVIRAGRGSAEIRTELTFSSATEGTAVSRIIRGANGEQRYRFVVAPPGEKVGAFGKVDEDSIHLLAGGAGATREGFPSGQAAAYPADKAIDIEIKNANGALSPSGHYTFYLQFNGVYTLTDHLSDHDVASGTFSYLPMGPNATIFTVNDFNPRTDASGQRIVEILSWTLHFNSANGGSFERKESDFRRGISKQVGVFKVSDFNLIPPFKENLLAFAAIEPAPEWMKWKDSDSWLAKFAKAEATFLRGRYAEAAKLYQQLETAQPGEAAQVFKQPIEVVGFRGYMASILAHDFPRVNQLENWMASNPANMADYFHKALLAYRRGNQTDGDSFVKIAGSHCNPAVEDWEVYIYFLWSGGWMKDDKTAERSASLRRQLSMPTAENSFVVAVAESIGKPISQALPSSGNPIFDSWCELAELASFRYSIGDDPTTNPLQERLFLPERSRHFTLQHEQEIGSDLLKRYDELADSSDLELQQATEEARSVFLSRWKLGDANDVYGNTPKSSLSEGRNLLSLSLKHALQEESDRSELERALNAGNSNSHLYVSSAPWSAETRQTWDTMMTSAANVVGNAQEKAKVTALLSYADMKKVDQAAALWTKYIIPKVQRNSGGLRDTAMVELGAQWNDYPGGAGKRVESYSIRNVSGRPLTRVFLKVEAQSEWHESAVQFYYFARLKVGEVARLTPVPRWDQEHLKFTNHLDLTYSLWSGEGSEVDRHSSTSSPNPDPHSAAHRARILDTDLRYEAQGIALGLIIQQEDFETSNPVHAMKVFRQAIRPGRAYAFRLAENGKEAKTYRLKFVSSGTEDIRVEITGLTDHLPLANSRRDWVGKIMKHENDALAVQFPAGWTVELGSEENLVIKGDPNNPAATIFGANEISLFPVSETETSRQR